jgi:flavin reductase (DIM6/NTAB) family NADH-FMN oxidoreductase RutF
MQVAADAPALGIHFLASDDRELARLFGEETGDDIDKFARCEWRPGPGGVPLLETKGGWLLGPVVDRHPVGDHVAMVVEPADARRASAGPQLGFHDVKDFAPGHPA